jgi:hypothetical protein
MEIRFQKLQQARNTSSVADEVMRGFSTPLHAAVLFIRTNSHGYL